MPQPNSSNLHVSVPLTNVSVAYQRQQNWIADKVFPIVPVMKQFDQYYRYNKGEWFRSVAEERAPGTESVGSGWSTTTDTYAARVYAVHKDIDDQIRANTDAQFNLDRDATEFITNDILLGREQNWFAKYWNTTTWATTAAGVTSTAPTADNQITQFNLGGDPVADIQRQRLRMKLLTGGYAPNVMVVTPQVDIALQQNLSIRDRIKYTQAGFVTPELLGAAFGMRYMVADAVQNTAPEATTDVSSMSFVATEGVLLAYVPPNPGLQTLSAGYTFVWNGYLANAFGTSVQKFRMEHIKSDRIEVESAYDLKVVASDCGLFISDPLA